MQAPDGLRKDLVALRRHLWFVGLVLIVALSAASASLLVGHHTREASFRAGVSVFNAPPLFGEGNLPQATDFAAVATSPDTLQKLSGSLAAQGLSLSPDQLAGMVTAKPRPGQNAIDFTVKNSDPGTALTIAREWNSVFDNLAPQAASGLELIAADTFQTQLQQADDELTKKRQAVSALGGPALINQQGAQFDAVTAQYQAKVTAISAAETERTTLQSTLDSLRAAMSDGTALSTAQLRLLLAGVLPPDALLEGSLSADQAAVALDLRLRAVDGSLASLRQEAQTLQTTLAQRSGDLQRALTEMQAAEDNYQVASRSVQSYTVTASTIKAEATTLLSPRLDRAGAMEWLARLSAAAALALVVGVIGTQLLALAPGRGARGKTVGSSGHRRRIPEQAPERTSAPTAAAQRGSGPLVLRQKRRALKRPAAGAALAAMTVALLVGFLGTFAGRRSGRFRAK